MTSSIALARVKPGPRQSLQEGLKRLRCSHLPTRRSISYRYAPYVAAHTEPTIQEVWFRMVKPDLTVILLEDRVCRVARRNFTSGRSQNRA